MRNRKRKISFMILLINLLFSMNVLSGCGSSVEGTGKSASNSNYLILNEDDLYDSSNTISITGWFEESYTQNLMAYLAEKYPDYKFEYRYISKRSYEPIIDAILASQAASDIIMVNSSMAKKHGQSGYLVDLTHYTDGFTNDSREAFMYRQKVYAVPSTSEYQCTFYNRTLLENSKRSLPVSFDEYLEICDYMKNEVGIKPISSAFKEGEVVADSALAFLASGYFTTDDGKSFGERVANGKASFRNELMPSLMIWQELVNHKAYEKEMCIMDTAAAVEEFAREESFMYVGKVEDYNRIMELNPDIRLGTMPSASEKKGFPAIIGGCSCGFAVSNFSKNKDIAEEIMADLATVEGQKALWSDRVGSQTFLKDTSFENPSTFDGLRATLSAGRVFSPWNQWGESSSQIYMIFGEEMQKVVTGERSMDIALKVVDDKVKQIQKQN